MIEREAPNKWIIIMSLPENLNTVTIKLFIFKLPKNKSNIKDVRVEYITG